MGMKINAELPLPANLKAEYPLPKELAEIKKKRDAEIILEEITQEEEKVPIEKLRWEKAHITEELKEKTIQYDNLGEQLSELDEINEQSREYEMKRQAVQMASIHHRYYKVLHIRL